MSATRTSCGTPKTYVIEVGPITSYGFGRADIARMERCLRRDMEALIRSYWKVGPRSKTVRTRIEEAP